MKYQEFAKILKNNIDSGIYQKSEKLPTEDELIAEYNVTRYCVRNAVNVLVDMGCIYSVQGSGIFVRKSNREGCLNASATKGFSAEYSNKEVKTKVIDFEVISADEDLSERMKCKLGTMIYYIVRLRIIDGVNFAVEYNYYNKEIIHYMNKEIAEGSLYSYVTNDLGLNIGFADKIILSDKLNKEDSKLLKLEEGDPALIVMDDSYLSNGLMFATSNVIYNYKYAKVFNLATMK